MELTKVIDMENLGHKLKYEQIVGLHNPDVGATVKLIEIDVNEIVENRDKQKARLFTPYEIYYNIVSENGDYIFNNLITINPNDKDNYATVNVTIDNNDCNKFRVIASYNSNIVVGGDNPMKQFLSFNTKESKNLEFDFHEGEYSSLYVLIVYMFVGPNLPKVPMMLLFNGKDYISEDDLLCDFIENNVEPIWNFTTDAKYYVHQEVDFGSMLAERNDIDIKNMIEYYDYPEYMGTVDDKRVWCNEDMQIGSIQTIDGTNIQEIIFFTSKDELGSMANEMVADRIICTIDYQVDKFVKITNIHASEQRKYKDYTVTFDGKKLSITKGDIPIFDMSYDKDISVYSCNSHNHVSDCDVVMMFDQDNYSFGFYKDEFLEANFVGNMYNTTNLKSYVYSDLDYWIRSPFGSPLVHIEKYVATI